MAKKLTPLRKRFCKELFSGKSATQALIDAGFKTKNRRNATLYASRLLLDPRVRAEVLSQDRPGKYSAAYKVIRPLIDLALTAGMGPKFARTLTSLALKTGRESDGRE